jgi:hypothetical protein
MGDKDDYFWGDKDDFLKIFLFQFLYFNFMYHLCTRWSKSLFKRSYYFKDKYAVHLRETTARLRLISDQCSPSNWLRA